MDPLGNGLRRSKLTAASLVPRSQDALGIVEQQIRLRYRGKPRVTWAFLEWFVSYKMGPRHDHHTWSFNH